MNRARRSAIIVAIVLVATSGGCLTVDPTVELNTTDSAVFEGTSVSGSWASGQVTTTVDLTANATTGEGVTQLNVIDAKGETFSTTTLDSGESSATVLFPTHGPATIVAVNTINGTTVESRNATITGNTLF